MKSDSQKFEITVIIPTHNPDPNVLQQTLSALAAQTMASDCWELIIVDNASNAVVAPDLSSFEKQNIASRVIKEPSIGLTMARLAGFAQSRGNLIILLDDDNVPTKDYLTHALEFALKHPHVGTFGGAVHPVFSNPPPEWFAKAGISLGCRDLGSEVLLSEVKGSPTAYPLFSPIGAGMVLRSEVAHIYQNHVKNQKVKITDRQGASLSSGGDCEIVLTSLFAGWETAYTPALQMNHLIPAGRTEPEYLCRLNRESSRSWVLLLARFGLNTWPPIPSYSLPIRKLRSWWQHRAWKSPLERIAWSGACGIFEGQAALSPET